MKKMLFNIIITIIGIVLLVIDLFLKEYHLTIITAFFLLFSVIVWYYNLYKYYTEKRLKIFVEKVNKLDRSSQKYKTLFVIYDYINGNENNMDIVTNALKEVYFYSKYMIKFHLKFKRKSYYNGLIEYYKTISKDKLGSNFIFDFNTNYFTWKFVSILLLIGSAGITALIYINQYTQVNLSIINTFLYVICGIFLIPFIIKVYDHLF